MIDVLDQRLDSGAVLGVEDAERYAYEAWLLAVHFPETQNAVGRHRHRV